jgi:hypothetical protein
MGLFDSWKKRSQRNTLYNEYKSLIGRNDRVAIIRAEELAILLDAMRIWEHEKAIPIQSELVQPLMPGKPSIGQFMKMVLRNKKYLRPSRAGIPYGGTPIGLKCRETGIVCH